jgi:hypothetical protein
MFLTKFINSSEGSIIVSIILGLGLASLFRTVCVNGRCIIYKSDSSNIQKNLYKLEGKCYKYTPQITPCEKENK